MIKKITLVLFIFIIFKSYAPINYLTDTATSAYLMFTELNTNIANNHILNIVETTANIDVASYTPGISFVSLICNGNLIETKQLIIN